MARLNDEGQWMILMAFIICIIIFFLALIANESILVGQTTAEGVLEFSKSDIQDLRHEIFRVEEVDPVDLDRVFNDIKDISLQRKSSIVSIDPSAHQSYLETQFHYNNGVTTYDETMYAFR